MTLFEVLIATFIFVISLGALLNSILGVLGVIRSAKDQTIAISDLRTMGERIKSATFSNMLTSFPNNTTDGPAANLYSNIVGSYALNNEHITVSYVNTATDPLEVKVTIDWQDNLGRSYNIFGYTFKTR